MSPESPQDVFHNPGTVHEHRDINVAAIVWFVVVLGLIVIFVDIAMWGLFKVFNHMESKNEPIVSPLALPAGQPLGPPGLQTTPWVDLKQFRKEQNAYLHGYGWVDETAGVARVPIEKAKALLLKQGLPVRPELADALEGTHVAAGGESNGGRTLPGGAPDKSSPVAPQTAPPAPPVTAPATPKGPGGGHD
jgi:hypothetical protein